jgi:hypothetical protein
VSLCRAFAGGHVAIVLFVVQSWYRDVFTGVLSLSFVYQDLTLTRLILFGYGQCLRQL